MILGSHNKKWEQQDMRLIVYYGFVLMLVLGRGQCTEDNGNMLMRTLDALTKAIHYMHEKVDEINLDAVFCTRQVQEQLQSYLINQPETFASVRHWLEVLRDKAKQVADEGLHYVSITTPEYTELVGIMANESKKLAWYPSLKTSTEYAVEPVSCSVYDYDYDTEDDCYHNMIGGNGKECEVSQSCYEFNEQYTQRAYGLTHQVIFWQEMEARKCVDQVSAERRMRLCSNVLRDVKRTAAANFPKTHQDIFMEQVGLCGIWGFKDFNEPEWLENILEWQHSSGCYKNPTYYYCFDKIPEETHKRVKRDELKLRDGCHSHVTAVALLTLVVNVRFEAEKLHTQMAEQIGRPDTLLY